MALQLGSQQADLRQQRLVRRKLRRSVLAVKGGRRQQGPAGAESGQQLFSLGLGQPSVVGGGSRSGYPRHWRPLHQQSRGLR